MTQRNYCGTCGAVTGNCEHTNRTNTDYDPLTGLIISGAVGYMTGSAILGGLIGGDFLGGVVGDVMESDDGFGLDDFL